jgi:hypothetical protein
MSYLYPTTQQLSSASQSSTLAGFSGFTSAEEPVLEPGFNSVLKVLAGPSPWQEYILPNLAIAKKNRPAKPFSILSLREFTDLLTSRGIPGSERNIPGFTDKKTGTITMAEWGPNTKSTFLGAALHEAVHLVSHPPQQGAANSTAWDILGQGLLEGMVECVTLDILLAQRIALAKPSMRGHQQRLKVAVTLLRTLSIPFLARVLFGGQRDPFEPVVRHTYSWNGWDEIKTLTTNNEADRALERMKFWRASQQRVHQIRSQQQFQQKPTQVNGLGQFGDGTMAEVNQAIRNAKAARDSTAERYTQIVDRTRGITTPAALAEKRKYWPLAHEVDFLEGLKQFYESQTGVGLNYTSYPVTKTDPNTNKSSASTPWRISPTRQKFSALEAGGSFCLGASRGMAFRSLFGLDRPSNSQVLTNLKKGIEGAKASGDVNTEAKLIISRLVSHLHDPGSLKQFNQDLENRYGVKNVIVKSADRAEALNALKRGVPVIADLEGGWHWVVVHQSPLGHLWANDPLRGNGIRRITKNDLGSRFELIVDASSGDAITPSQAKNFKK